VIRGWYFDHAIRRFIDTHTRPVVVNVGCGLDTRYQRVGNDGKAVFYELDLPEVIAIRRRLIPEPENDCYLSASLLETDWMDRIRLLHPNGDFIFVVEGVLMYFREEQVRTFLHNITMRFEGGELWFDVCGTMMSRCGVKPDSLREHKAQIRSGIDDGHMVELWEPGLHLLEQANYMKSGFKIAWNNYRMKGKAVTSTEIVPEIIPFSDELMEEVEILDASSFSYLQLYLISHGQYFQ
jgi:O-methyltransferase involved in polyketide biosynthesis